MPYQSILEGKMKKIIKCIICGLVFTYDRVGRPPRGCPKHKDEAAAKARKISLRDYYVSVTKKNKKSEKRSRKTAKVKEIATWDGNLIYC